MTARDNAKQLPTFPTQQARDNAKHRRKINDVLINMGLALREAPSCALLIRTSTVSFEFDLSATAPSHIIHKIAAEAYEQGRNDEQRDTLDALRNLMGFSQRSKP